MKLPRQQRKLAKQAKAQGWEIRRTRGDHLVWVAPNGRKVYSSATPSDHRAVKNQRARLRRAGLKD
jgi:predicted RNA binding protein YcfA (HicA-like mRNA interferase family)